LLHVKIFLFKIVQDDIVHIRANSVDKSNVNMFKKDEKMGIDEFHSILVVARLQTLSYGKSELGLYEWNKSKNLECDRLKTL
jgi:hypothetical protein